MAVYNSYDVIGTREDLQNAIWDVSPSDTPFMSSIAKVTATNTLHEWQTDELSAPKANARVEGADAGDGSHSPTVRLGNYTQISDEVAKVSGTNQKTDKAGRGNELDYQIVKKSLEIKTDMEFALLKNGAKVAGDGSTARQLAGVETWISTNVNSGAGAVEATGDGSDVRTAGTTRTFAEAQLKDVMQKCYISGGKPSKMFLSAPLMDTFGTFDGNQTRNVDANKKAIEAAVDVYVSNFGTVMAEPSRIVNSTTALVIDPSLFKVGVLREFKENELAKTGDFDKVQIITEYTLASLNEKGSGAVYDITA